MIEIEGITARDLRRVLGDDAKAIIENQTAMIQAMAQVAAGLINDVMLLQRKVTDLKQRVSAFDLPRVTES